MKFKCKSCGDCCKNFGEKGTLPLFDEEKKLYEKLANDLGIDIEFVPENVMIENETGAMFSSNWGLKGNSCPFLDKENKCKIYDDRALICRAFPIEKIPINNEGLNLGCFMKCPNFDHQKFINSEKSFMKIYGKDPINARLKIQEKQRDISEKIFGLISLGKIKINKTENFYIPDVIAVERFLETLGL